MKILFELLRTFAGEFRTDSRPIGLKHLNYISNDELLNQLFQETAHEANPFHAVAPTKVKPKSMPLQPVAINQTYTYQSGVQYKSFLNR